MGEGSGGGAGAGFGLAVVDPATRSGTQTTNRHAERRLIIRIRPLCSIFIERRVNTLKWFRRVATRYEKLAIQYLGMVTLAIIFRLL